VHPVSQEAAIKFKDTLPAHRKAFQDPQGLFECRLEYERFRLANAAGPWFGGRAAADRIAAAQLAGEDFLVGLESGQR
jgi:hypothetical protein